MPSEGLAARRGDLRTNIWWSEYFNAEQFSELETELRILSQCCDDERSAFVSAQLGLSNDWGHAGETFVTVNIVSYLSPDRARIKAARYFQRANKSQIEWPYWE